MGLNMDGGSTTALSIVLGVEGMSTVTLKGSGGVWGTTNYYQPHKDGGGGS